MHLVPSQPAAFMSYVRFNDQRDDGQLTEFREYLSAEIRVQIGEEFLIFQDRNDIAWGQNWQQRIDQALDAATLLLVIITPGFFRSTACRAEVERFLKREQDLGRQDLILPVYYVSTPELDDTDRRDADPLAQLLATRQFADWRELRFEPFTSPVVRKALSHLATRMRDSFWRSSFDGPRPDKETTQTPGSPIGHEAATETARSAIVIAKSEPPTHIVDSWGRRGCTTIAEAVEGADPGDRILVYPGLYLEPLVITKPLEILGYGPVADIVLSVRGTDVIEFKANIGRIANLTMRQTGGKYFAVDITQGRLELEGCDISGSSLSCVAIHEGADPRLSRNIIHHSKQSGVLVFHDGLGTLEDNEITANTMGGVAIRDGGNPTLRRNRINHNGYAAVWMIKGGRGVFEDNDLTDNGRGAWDITADCAENVIRIRNRELSPPSSV